VITACFKTNIAAFAWNDWRNFKTYVTVESFRDQPLHLQLTIEQHNNRNSFSTAIWTNEVPHHWSHSQHAINLRPNSDISSTLNKHNADYSGSNIVL